MAKSVPTINIKGPAGKLVCNDTEQQRRLFHEKGYTLEDGSSLVAEEQPEFDASSTSEPADSGDTPPSGDTETPSETEGQADGAVPAGQVRV